MRHSIVKINILALAILILIGCAGTHIPSSLHVEYANQNKINNIKIAILGGLFLDTRKELLEDVPKYLKDIPEQIIHSFNSKFSKDLINKIISSNPQLDIMSFEQEYNILSSPENIDKANKLISNILLSSLTDDHVTLNRGYPSKWKATKLFLDIKKIPSKDFFQLCDMLHVDAIAFPIISSELVEVTGGGLVSITTYNYYILGNMQVIQVKNDHLFTLWSGYTDYSSAPGKLMGMLRLEAWGTKRDDQIIYYNNLILSYHLSENMAHAFLRENDDKFNLEVKDQKYAPFLLPSPNNPKILISYYHPTEKTRISLDVFDVDKNLVKKYNSKTSNVIHSIKIEDIWSLVGSDRFLFQINVGENFKTPLYEIKKYEEK